MCKRKDCTLLKVCVVWAFLVLLLMNGCGGSEKGRFSEEELAQIDFGQRPILPEYSGGAALAIGGDVITVDEIVGPLMKELGRGVV